MSVQKVHFECLQPDRSRPLEIAQVDSGDTVVLMDPEPERSVNVVDDDTSQHYNKTEQLLSEASYVSLPSRGRHWMDTRLRTRLRAGGSRMHYQQFDYSTSGVVDELSDVMLPIPPVPRDADQVDHEVPMPSSDQSISPTRQLLQLSSDHERVRSPSPQPTASEKDLSLLGTSAPLLTNPSFPQQLSYSAYRHPIATQVASIDSYDTHFRHTFSTRYKCGTCGLRDCVCLLAVSENRGFPLDPGEFLRKGEKRKVLFIALPSEPRRHILLSSELETTQWTPSFRSYRHLELRKPVS